MSFNRAGGSGSNHMVASAFRRRTDLAADLICSFSEWHRSSGRRCWPYGASAHSSGETYDGVPTRALADDDTQFDYARNSRDPERSDARNAETGPPRRFAQRR